ncbi:uncharacterized protein si:ch211-14a17.10 [Maylandia zebra]|uniref:uncharacterized protein si:ch211-14a17.10 n=1 Tax=Maylandia zebra TaxID=106582 RepID=UPI00403C201D
MAGGSQFIWIPLLFTCVLCTSDPRAGHNRLVRTGNPDLDAILSRILLSTDFQNSPVNVTSIVIKTCTGVKETLEVLQRKLQQANHRYNQLGDEAFGLRTEVIQLKVELAACMSTASSTSGTYQPNLQLKMKQVLEKLDGDTLLLFKIMTLTGEVSTLQEKIKLATNSNRTADEIAELQKELDKTTAELKDQIQEAEESLSNATLILQIISLQNQLWDLQEAETRGGKPNSGSSIGMTLVKEQLNRKIVLLQEKGGGYSANLLELIYVRTKIAELKRMIIDAIEKSKTFAADARKQWMQKIDLLRKLIIQLNDDENNRELTLQIMRVQAEVLHFQQLMRNAKNITDSQIQGFRVLLDREKQRHDVLQRQLEAVEYVKAQQIVQVISLIEEMKKQHLTGQPTTVRGVTEKEYIEAQAKIRELQRKLRLKTELDSKFVKRYEQVKIDFDRKIAELKRTEDFQPALIVKLMSLHDELKALKDQISLSEDKDLTSELRKQLERKQEELSSGIADIERLTSSPGAILKILELQHELWTLRNKATNGATSDREEDLQDRLDGFIDEINNRAGENTKLILKIISLQSQLEHLETLLSQTYNSNSPSMVIIRNTLTDKLTLKRAELQKYINELNNKNPANARLILVIAELYKHLKRIEIENRDDNAESSLTLTLLQMFLQNKNREYALMKDKFAELERQLLLKTHECSGLEQQRNQLKTEVEDKIAELNKTKDFKTALLLNVINMKAEVRALKEQISNSKDPEIISQLQMQLEKKQDELITKTAEMEELLANPRVVLQIIELQNEIWDLQNKDVNGTAGDRIKALQNRIDTLMAQIGSSDRDNTKLTLKILNLQSQVKHLQNLLSNRESQQTSELTEITNELAAKKGELEKHVNELKQKNQENANLILNITDLQSQLENLEKVKTAEDKESAATISNLRKQLKVKELEHSRDQEVILDLQEKLNETERCSDDKQKITDLQQNLNDKIKELQSKSSSVTSLALQISTLTQQVEQLKAQMNNSVSKSKVDELQKAIDEKNEELDKLTKELKERSTQPQRLLQIIALQTEIEKLVTVAENNTDDEKIKARQEELNSLIEGIKDEQNENIKLTFQILNQQDEIARLKKQQNRKNETQEAQIKDLEDQLEAIRNEIQQKTDLLDRKDINIANLSAQIMELHEQIKPLENNIAALKEAHTKSLADLQRKLKLKERQLDDTESQLEHIDAENFKYVMEIADLRAKLKEAETQTSDKIKDVEKKLKTQETKNKKLEAANKDVEKKLKTQEAENKKLEAANKELEKKLQLKTQECSGLEQQRNQLKTEVEDKIAELNKTKDFKTALLLNVINMKAEVRALKEQISNSKDPEIISQLQMQLEKKQDELITKTAEMEELLANPRVVLQIIELQNEIWDLQNKDVNGTAGDQIKALQNRIDTLMAQIGSSDRDNTKLTLKILNLQSQVKHLQNLLSNRESQQTSELTEITNELAAKKGELEKHVNELKQKNQENANLILNITDLQSQLENLEKVKTAEDKESAATISNLRKQLKVKELEHSRDQEVILDLQEKLNETESCSDYEQTITDLQQNLNDKIKELQSKSSSVTSLALQISTLTQQVEQLKAQMNNSVSKSKVDELQKAIDEKNEELDKLTKELKERSTQPRRLLQIIALQTEIEKLDTVAENDRDEEKIKVLQGKLTYLIDGVKDEQGENIKLTFQILNQQAEIARLKKEEEKKNQAQEAKIKDLENQLEAMRNQRNTRSAAQIMELEVQIKELEDNIAALKEAHTESLADLQRRLKLKERQLDDTESQLEHIDAENFKYVMEIADLRVKLKKAVTQTSDKKIKDVEKKLKTQEAENKKLEAANKELEKKLQLKTQECSGLEQQRNQLKTEVEDKIAELNKTKDFKTALLLNVINMKAEVRALKEQISNSKDPEIISQLQMQLEKKQDELITKTAEMEELLANPRVVLQIIELQNEIWDLQNKDVNGTAGDQIKALQNRIDTLMAQIGSSDRDNTKLTLKILNLQSQVKHLQNLLSNRESQQTSELTEITNELAAKKGELEKHVNELKQKNQENANLILNITDLQSQLENLEKVKTAEDKESAATISNLRKQLKVKELEHSRDQEVILDLQEKLNETERCSDDKQKITDLQQNLNDKIKELQSKSSSVTSLALQISTLTQQVEQLKAQMNNSVSKSKVDELQKAIDEKNEELDKLTKELKERSTQPQRLLQIIALQTEIEKLVTVAENNTDDEKIKARQEELNSLIEGIKDEQNENIKLTFQILNQQDEIARLKKQQNRKNETQEAQIKDLEDQLEAIRNEIQQKTDLLDRKDINIANLSAQIMELHEQIKPLENNIAALKEAHTKSLADLQRKLKLKERQLDDTESQLEHIDAENFKYVMEIADLRAKLKEAETQTSDKIKDVEKKLKTQETKNKKLEAANKDLKQEVTELKMCCSQPPEECEDLRRDLQQCHDDADRQLQELHQKDAKLNQLEQELQRQNRENNKLQNNIDRLQRELGDIEEKTIHTSKMTFDPDTAHPRIVLSDDETEMSTADFIQDVPNNPRRFDVILGALGATGFSSGKHYWEVSVAGKTCYHLGMTSESSRRKGSIPFSPNNDYWTIVLDKQGQYRAIEQRRTVPIPTEIQPVTLGILLDYKKGTISFYDSGSRTHMYSFVGQHFTGKIYPFVNFCVEDGSAPNPVVLITPGATDWIK